MTADARLLSVPAKSRRSMLPTVVIDIDECPRCGRSHPGIEMRRFHRPSGRFVVSRTYVRLVAWSTCPRTAEQITHAELDR